MPEGQFEEESSLTNPVEFLTGRAKKAPRPEPARHRWVRQWLIAKGDALRRLIAENA